MGIAIMCSGGDSAGMNPAIKKFVDYTFDLGREPYLIYDGLEGLIDDKIEKATHEKVAGIVHDGGTMLRSSRSKRFFEYDYRKQAYENLKKRGIDKLVVLGGDGSFRAFNQFHKDFDVNFVGVPSTIDNDIFGTDYCLGVDTALNIIRSALDDIRDTAYSFKRAFVIETMGRDCGYLALISALTSGAEICVIPELPFDKDSLTFRIKEEVANGRGYLLAVVSEGTGRTSEMVDWLNNEIKMETRATILGHIQRGGNPTVYDRLMAFEFVTYAVDKLLSEKSVGSVVVYKDAKFEFRTIEYINSGKYEISEDLLKLAKKLTSWRDCDVRI
jgi:6-phosphofructokinase 1